MAPKRKGGGTKGFLKTAARAGAEPGDDAAPQEAVPTAQQQDADQRAADAAPPPAAPLADSLAPNSSTANAANGSAAAAEPSTKPEDDESRQGGAEGGDETRGQMLQRHKKVLDSNRLLQAAECHELAQQRERPLLKVCCCLLQEAKALKDTAKKMGKKRKVHTVVPTSSRAA